SPDALDLRWVVAVVKCECRTARIHRLQTLKRVLDSLRIDRVTARELQAGPQLEGVDESVLAYRDRLRKPELDMPGIVFRRTVRPRFACVLRETRVKASDQAHFPQLRRLG